MNSKVINYLKNSKIIESTLRLLDDETFLKVVYRIRIGKRLNLKDPKTFNEKLQWLKIHDRKEAYTKMVDKYEAKKYVAKKYNDDIVIPTIGVYDSFDEIDFDKLPNQFVIKCTHDSGGLIVCRDKNKLDKKAARKKINRCLKNRFYYHGREWPYKNVKPRILVEEYMVDKKTDELRDYKFFCFNGKVEFFKVDFNRFIKHQANYYDTNGKLLRFGEVICPPDYNKTILLPKNLKKMISIAEKLSSGICFVRIDLYDVNGKVYFGEITFYPASGFGKFVPEEWDEKLGDFIDLRCAGRGK